MTNFVYNNRAVSIDGLPGDHIFDAIVERQKFYESRMLNFICTTIPHFGGGIVDVGANIGNHTVFFGLFTDAPCILAIEPNPRVLPFLIRNVNKNGLQDKVVICRCAAGSEPGWVGLTPDNPHNLGSTSITLPGAHPTVPMLPLDDMLALAQPSPAPGWKHTTLLKIDVEGYELNVLRGATKVLTESHPHLFIEAQTAAQKFEIDEFLQPFGYQPSQQVFNWTPTYYWY